MARLEAVPGLAVAADLARIVADSRHRRRFASLQWPS